MQQGVYDIMIVDIKPHKINLPPQQIYKFEANDDMIKYMQDFAPRCNYDEEHNGCSYSVPRDAFPSTEKGFMSFISWVNACLDYIKNDLKIDCERVEVSQAWLTRSKKGYKIKRHHHSNSIFSAVYYVHDTNGTKLYQENEWTKDLWDGMVFPISPTVTKTEIPYVHPAKAGDLIVFPSAMQHDSEPQTQDLRYIVALNSFPRGMLGHYEILTGVSI